MGREYSLCHWVAFVEVADDTRRPVIAIFIVVFVALELVKLASKEVGNDVLSEVLDVRNNPTSTAFRRMGRSS